MVSISCIVVAIWPLILASVQYGDGARWVFTNQADRGGGGVRYSGSGGGCGCGDRRGGRGGILCGRKLLEPKAKGITVIYTRGVVQYNEHNTTK